ncbi:hypothetical protein GOC74_16790 [Halomicrobium mukohataei]|uniref:Sulfatase N-terminal domain-containing protein n=1 Tax=Halomicrobium mukohataei TaxID=57705 RepID=A0A847UDM7_9EURY|nr:hypothetical protein [Halomicrobium mukohataei]NLV11585.1 hypothetical protein [Halomicrobium mukohataei]
MYDKSEILLGIKNPYLLAREVNRSVHKKIKKPLIQSNCVDILNEDWDNLLILDACRYDYFKQESELPGTLDHRLSQGSSTTEFLIENFQNEKLHDTVYITANPMIYKKTNQINAEFYDICHVWNKEWDNDLYTVPPEAMTEYIEKYSKKHPNKKLLIHYNQPHHPFIGPTAEKNLDFSDYAEPVSNESRMNFWLKVSTGNVDISTHSLRQAYVETLRYTLPHIKDAIKLLNGKTVVSADHGEMLGERMSPLPIKGFGHPNGLYPNTLLKVPWLEHTRGERRKIIAEDPVSTVAEDDLEHQARERLGHLGYLVE